MRKRMLDPSFWDDSDAGSLSIPARLLFIGLISHADDEGRGIADPRQLRKQVFGFDDITNDEVEKMLNEIGEKIRNVKFYTHDGREYYCLTNWFQYQKISHPTASTLPAPNGATPPVAVVGKSNVFKSYEDNIGPLTPIIADKLKDAEGIYPEGYILDAFAECVRLNKRNWAYAETILERWMVEGREDKRPKKEIKVPAGKSAIAKVLKSN